MSINEHYKPIDLFHRLIYSKLTSGQKELFYNVKMRIVEDARIDTFLIEYSLVSRKFSDKRIIFKADESEYYQKINICLQESICIDHLIRIYLGIQASFLFTSDESWVIKLCASASIIELVSFYQGIQFYNIPEKYLLQTQNGVRNNINPVFEAIAYKNTYPERYFTESNWNQLILKTVFIGKPLFPIIGLEKRANKELTRMLCDYAQERWAAKRAVTPEIWRCVGAAKDNYALDILEEVYSSQNDIESRAAALAIGVSSDKRSNNILATNPILKEKLEKGNFSWTSLGFNPLL